MALICATITGMTADYPDAPPRLAPFLEHAAEVWYVRDLYAVAR